MAITVNTNMAAIKISNNLETATSKMDNAMERMSSGSKINSASDDPAGYSVSTKLSNTISGLSVAKDNVAIGNDLLSTTEGSLNVVQTNLSRIQDLITEAANGTYSSDDLSSIQSEVSARFDEISSVTTNAKFNGKTLFSGKSVLIQAGTTSDEKITIASSVFGSVTSTSGSAYSYNGTSYGSGTDGLKGAVLAAFAAAIGGTDASALASQLSNVSSEITSITTRETNIGAAQNKMDSVSDALTTTDTNLTSALSTVKDSDTATDSADYVQQQILQEISTSLLSSANQASQIAYKLVQGTQG